MMSDDNDYGKRFCQKCDAYRGYVCAEHRTPSYSQLQDQVNRLQANLAAAEARFNEMDTPTGREIELRQRLRDQTHQTQITAQQKHDAVLEAINRHGGVPAGIDPQGHPIEQIVGTVLATWEIAVDRLKEKLAKAEALVIDRWTHEHQSTIDQILQSHIDDVNKRLAAAEALLREAVKRCKVDDEEEWEPSLLPDEWFERAERSLH